MLYRCWAAFVDRGPTPVQYWVDVSYLLGSAVDTGHGQWGGGEKTKSLKTAAVFTFLRDEFVFAGDCSFSCCDAKPQGGNCYYSSKQLLLFGFTGGAAVRGARPQSASTDPACKWSLFTIYPELRLVPRLIISAVFSPARDRSETTEKGLDLEKLNWQSGIARRQPCCRRKGALNCLINCRTFNSQSLWPANWWH